MSWGLPSPARAGMRRRDASGEMEDDLGTYPRRRRWIVGAMGRADTPRRLDELRLEID